MKTIPPIDWRSLLHMASLVRSMRRICATNGWRFMLFLLGVFVTLSAGCGPDPGGVPAHDGGRASVTALQAVKLAVMEYRAANGRFPQRAADLENIDTRVDEPFLRPVPMDSWGRPFRYRASPDLLGFEIRSAGPDGLFETEDDESVGEPAR